MLFFNGLGGRLARRPPGFLTEVYSLPDSFNPLDFANIFSNLI